MPRLSRSALLPVCLALATLAGCGGVGTGNGIPTTIAPETTSPVDVSAGAPNHAPVIDTNSTVVVGAGRPVQLAIGISDPDGDRVTVAVSQKDASISLGNLRSDVRGVRFDAPNVERATSVDLVLTATDPAGLAAETTLSVVVSPVSPSGKLFTVMGSLASDGLHWVITGDGFTADQQQQLLQSALAMAKEVTEAPELALHAAVWNVHVLTAVSLESGVAARFPRHGSVTAFDARLNCTGVERIACLNWGKVLDAALAEHIAFDAVAVILNTELYVGSTSASGMVVSRNVYANRIALHEMGHLVAGLADEYVDAHIARHSMPQYQEWKFPNVTTVSDPGLIPWRHWFADPAHIPVDPAETGVGRFEGAFYAQNGFYRPKHDSTMRTLEAPLGEVNAEAWLRALYRAVPPLSTAHPRQTVVSGLAGDSLEFDVVSPWPREAIEVRWWVDGAEIESARDSRRYVFAADGGAHEVQAWLSDRTGLIRDPRAREQTGYAHWSVSGNPAALSSKALPEAGGISGWIHLHVDATGHTVVGKGAAEGSPRRLSGALEGQDFEYTLVDADGRVLSQGRLADPRFVRGPMAPPGTPAAGHEVGLLESGDYLIGIPAGAEARRIRIRGVNGMEKTAPDSTAASPIEQWLDL